MRRGGAGPRRHDHDRAPESDGGTDATSTVTVEDGAVMVFIGVDHCTLEGIGIHAAKRATRFEALRTDSPRGAPAVRHVLGRHRNGRAGAA
ncbi:MAG: hypothetical protein AB7F94_15045 [Nitrospira sp.]